MDNVHHLIDSVEYEDRHCRVVFHSSLSIVLTNLRICLLNAFTFSTVSPLNYGLYRVLKKQYR